MIRTLSRHGLALAGLVLLAGCSSWWNSFPSYSVYGSAPADSVRGQCERAAYDDPEMQAALAVEAGNVGHQQQALIDLEKVKQRVVERCLRRRGVRGGAGVERPEQ
jgi:hypothetical protein